MNLLVAVLLQVVDSSELNFYCVSYSDLVSQLPQDELLALFENNVSVSVCVYVVVVSDFFHFSVYPFLF